MYTGGFCYGDFEESNPAKGFTFCFSASLYGFLSPMVCYFGMWYFVPEMQVSVSHIQMEHAFKMSYGWSGVVRGAIMPIELLINREVLVLSR